MNNSPASNRAKRLIRRCGAGSTTPHPESLSLIGDLRLSVELSRRCPFLGMHPLVGRDLARLGQLDHPCRRRRATFPTRTATSLERVSPRYSC